MITCRVRPRALRGLLLLALVTCGPALAQAEAQQAPDELAGDDGAGEREKKQEQQGEDGAEAAAEAPSDSAGASPPAGSNDPKASPPGDYDDLYNKVHVPEIDAPPSPEKAPQGPVVEDDGPSEGDPADTTPTIRTYRPSEQPEAAAGLTAPREDPGLFGLYFPLTMYTELDAKSADLQPWFFLGGLLPAGQAWLPLLVSKEPAPDGFIGDAALLLLVHALPHLLVLGTLPCGLLAFGIPVVGQILFVTVFLLNLVNVTAFLATNFYFMPVALVNAYDRGVRTQAGTAEGSGRVPQARPMAY